MIEGLVVTMKSEELKAHLEERAQFHTNRAINYGHQVTSLQDLGEEVASMSSIDSVGNMKRKVEDHQSRAAYFKFMAEHVVPSEEYHLSQSDLREIELSGKYF